MPAPAVESAAVAEAAYPILQAGVVDADGPCAATEAAFRRHRRYVAVAQSVARCPDRVILDTRFGALLRPAGPGWETVPGAFCRPFRPGEAAYLQEIADTLPRALQRDRVADLTVPPGGCVQFPLLSRWSRVYFHLLSECLPQVALLAGAFPPDVLRAITVAERTAVQQIAQDEAEQRGIATVVAPTRFAWVNNVAFYTGFHRHAAINACFASAMAAIRARILPAPPVPPHRLVYVSRLGATARPLGNEEALARRVAALGFEVVDPASLPFAEQVRLFASARVVTGPHGAGLANAAFSAPGTVLVELRPLNRKGQSPMLNESYRRIAAVQGLRYDAAMFANPPDSEAWTIDIDRAARILDRAAALGGAEQGHAVA